MTEGFYSRLYVERLLVIACDGLWKVFPNDDVPRFIELQLNKEKNINDVTTVDQETLEGLAAKLASEAVRRQCGDNVSVILVKLSKF